MSCPTKTRRISDESTIPIPVSMFIDSLVPASWHDFEADHVPGDGGVEGTADEIVEVQEILRSQLRLDRVTSDLAQLSRLRSTRPQRSWRSRIPHCQKHGGDTTPSHQMVARRCVMFRDISICA